ncbi:serine hydrolase domain-containing protein [Pseudooctadecabacter jejudonensis]|uniref:6-aminohexanoate-dimer hydrolase n=1 Tax=Pseudooctadecabacter jejudonensis TaxID=1391910 RepID=A0A1Y5SNP5_9RHOB|nr:serine hydrolase [Pseudooctadecabacter jejudonensis]SLN44728.1 6-aminohexanoate-dimer hydrolase [Pseudooctadecabacter jejudonensis]
MTRFFKWTGLGLMAVIIITVALGLWHRDRVMRLLAVNSLFAEDRIVGNFIAMDTMFNTAPLPVDPDRTNRLGRGADMDMPPGFARWLNDRSVTGIIVAQNGVIRHESYPLTAEEESNPAQSRRISWSVAKSYLSTLLGILHEDGTLPDLDAPVTQYVPALVGSAYDGATIRNVLQMSSGVTFDEDYLDFWSDINRMGRVLAFGQSMDEFAANLTETFIEPGAEWQYVSIDTHVIGMVIRGATGRTIPDLLTEKILTPLGTMQPPYYSADGDGVAFVLGGLNLTTHDYALFGHMIASGGIAFGTRIVSEDWIEEATAPSAPTDPRNYGYGYQWWVPVGATKGQFLARGVYGQYIYIDRRRGVVIAVNAADRKFRQPGVGQSNVDMFRRIAERLD